MLTGRECHAQVQWLTSRDVSSSEGLDAQPQGPMAWVSISNLSTLKAVVVPVGVRPRCPSYSPPLPSRADSPHVYHNCVDSAISACLNLQFFLSEVEFQ